jgi:hypothetical protein
VLHWLLPKARLPRPRAPAPRRRASQPKLHRTIFFRDPDGNIVEIYADI